MFRKKLITLLSMFLGVLILLAVSYALTAGNTVQTSAADELDEPVDPNQLAPPECSSLGLTLVVVLSNGTQANDLILGSASGDSLGGQNGTDCIVGGDGDDSLRGLGDGDVLVGGAGNDDLRGGQGDDVIYGGDGDDDINGGNGTDECFGGGGTDTFTRCEIIHDP
jgi:Ca2+-binding RTX toxin-like protein